MQRRRGAYVLSGTATTPEGLEVHMHIITGITGQVGGQAATAFLDAVGQFAP